MRIEHLTLEGFRNYGSLTASFGPGPHVIAGPNAAGKTNLIEALLMLGTARSHRATGDGEMIGWGHEYARVEGEVASEGPGAAGRRATLEIVLARSGGTDGGITNGHSGDGGSARKRIRVNGVGRRARSLAEELPVVLFSPEDMSLIVGPPAARRAALDGLVVALEPTTASTLATYSRVLVQRNNLLRAVRDGLADRAELAFWSEQLSVEGGRIVVLRRRALAALAGPFAEAHREIAPDEGGLTLAYASNASPVGDEDPPAALRRRLAETAEKELWNGVTLVGPHRDDAVFELDTRPMAGFASRGQQRTAILAFKLGQLDVLHNAHGRWPLLLLDDVFSELDPTRRAHLVRRIGELPQSFVTTTSLDDLDPALVAASTAWQASSGRLTGGPVVAA